MEIEEGGFVTLADNVTTTRVILASTSGQRKHSNKGDSFEKSNSKGTQTVGHVFLGKQGEVIITTNYALVTLVIDNDAVDRLTDRGTDVNQFTDMVTTSLARLDWNGERILENAMTSFRLTFNNEVMPRLVEEITGILKTEPKHHKVQHLVQHILEKHSAKLFGIDVGSLIFILEHCSVDDARMTLNSRGRQEELQRAFLSFLPDWVEGLAEVHVTTYTLTADDRAPDFGFIDPENLSFAASPHEMEKTAFRSSGSGVSPRHTQDVEVHVDDGSGGSAAMAYTGGRESARGHTLRTMGQPTAPSRSEDTQASSGVLSSQQVMEEESGIAAMPKDIPHQGWAEMVRREERETTYKKTMKRKKACCVM